MKNHSDAYGRSPALDAVQHLRKFNALPAEQRARAATSLVKRMIAVEDAERALHGNTCDNPNM
jgi:hypothetical protein